MESEEKMGKDNEKQESRRKFLKTAGKFAIYTPPALMVMSTADATKIARSGGHNGCNYPYKRYRKIVKRRVRRRRIVRRVNFRRWFS